MDIKDRTSYNYLLMQQELDVSVTFSELAKRRMDYF